MEELIVWLLAAFGCSSLLVMIAERWTNRTDSVSELPHEHYRLLVHNSEQVLERVVRSLLFRSYWSGRPIRITLIDEGSDDDTKQMAAVLNRYPYGHCLGDAHDDRTVGTIVIDLREKKEGA
ncbi:glycosyltransferase family 2 protein [Brevibacillus sp. 179-C 1.1 NHS]|uniref:glycosyltransferase family 2 protein n=1 Tax=Brevibacillus sp. 179-C 1.1 NHS TaxID=3235177 RepID=UPI0039A34534